MTAKVHLVLGASLRLYIPLLIVFALSLMTSWRAGSGVGFAAGAVLALVLTLHVLVFGAAAARVAFPPAIARPVLALGVIVALGAAGLPGWSWSEKAQEGGLLLATVAGAALILLTLAGRAPTLRDEDW